jgi:hypothetical protein
VINGGTDNIGRAPHPLVPFRVDLVDSVGQLLLEYHRMGNVI